MDKVINLTHITILQWILIVILSGVAVAVINQLGAWMVGSRQARSQERIQKNDQAFNERLHREERENQSLQLLITAHFNQRENSLKDAVDALEWIWYQNRTLHGPDHDYFGQDDPPPNINTVTEVLSALNRVSYFHPTRSVRSQAKGLESSIALHFNSPNAEMNGVGGDPSYDQLSKWTESAEELVELIHTPPSLNEVRHSNGDVDIQSSTAHKGKALQRIRRHFTKTVKASEVFGDL